jgi:hypothetical protein
LPLAPLDGSVIVQPRVASALRFPAASRARTANECCPPARPS